MCRRDDVIARKLANLCQGGREREMHEELFNSFYQLQQVHTLIDRKIV